MAASVDTSFTDQLKDRIKQKSTKFGQFHCLLWQGAKWGKSSYGKLAVTLPGSSRRVYFRLHRLVYMLYHNFNPLHAGNEHFHKFSLPSHDENGNIMDVSHLCHTPLCTNPDHLILELHSTNMECIHCKNQGSCTHQHSPHCLM